MVRILIFGMTENPGGIESVIMNYYRAIDKSKIQFDFLCNSPEVAYEEEIQKLGGKIYKIASRSNNACLYYKELRSFFKNNAVKYKTIWVNICSLANIDYLKYAKKYGIKYRIVHCHNSQNMDSKARKILHIINKFRLKKYATDYWTCSEDANNWFFTNNILEKNKIVCINNAIDYNKFKFNEKIRQEYRNKLNIDSKLVFAHVGRLHFEKNQLMLLDIFKNINEMNGNVELLLIGDGEDRAKIENKIKKLELENNVRLLGIRNDVEKIMQSVDAIIFPSLFEGLPLVLIEAQANGLPIFASKSISEQVVIGENVELISLDEKPKEWAIKILSSNLNRCDNYEKIKIKGFDIKIESKKIEELLMRE